MGDAPTLTGPPLEETGPLTMGAFLLDVCARFRGNDSLVFDDPLRGGATVRRTYADLEAHARRIGGALLAAGIGKGARVGILMGNRPDAVASLFGAALAGAVAVPLSTFSPKPELAHLFEHADLSALLLQPAMGSRRFVDDVHEIRATGTHRYLRHVAVLGEASWTACSPQAARRSSTPHAPRCTPPISAS